MNLRRSVTALFALVLTLSALAFPTTASAYDTGNYAGKADTCSRANPTCGGTYNSSCHWTIYGRVDNRMVLFGPNHCYGVVGPNWGPGQPVYNGSGQRLGVIASSTNGASAADMTWMWLDAGQYPASKNVIVVNGTDWTITSKYPSSSLSCTNLLAGSSGPLATHNMYVGYWTENVGYEGPFSGRLNQVYSKNNGSGHCVIATSVPFDAGSRHVPSGAPWIDATIGAGTGFLGGTTDCATTCAPGIGMRFNSWRQAIIDLNNYWQVHGSTVGAWFCSNASCT